MPPVALIINSGSGGSSKEEMIAELLSKEKFAHFRLVHLDTKDVKGCVEKLIAKGYPTIVAAGGDGTISSIAGSLMEIGADVKFGVLPLGTFNHFAKDLGMPLGIEEALEVLSKGKSQLIDIGKVNDAYFVNNSSLGLYPRIIRHREQFRKKGWRKGVALVAACFSVLRSDLSLTIEFEADGKKSSKRTPFVFIGNNRYDMGGLTFGKRKRLDEGSLSICVARPVSKLGILLFFMHALKGTLIEHKDFNIIGLSECVITSGKRRLDVTRDGEISKMKAPLRYEILPKALSVIIP